MLGKVQKKSKKKQLPSLLPLAPVKSKGSVLPFPCCASQREAKEAGKESARKGNARKKKREGTEEREGEEKKVKSQLCNCSVVSLANIANYKSNTLQTAQLLVVEFLISIRIEE
uniref:hypothetical protein 56 n=1 Tax=Moniliophthora perniciosa TaxID=153609 RepID=UPI0000242383|nr:hypothetical protein 56 [Moniliophthora perniciosa]AAQ74348.1 hypothetical protein 56 [Moniliophthora perniciosa]